MLSKRRSRCFTPLETHRLKQREQYKTMLTSLETLTKILPYISTESRMRTKQMILTECARYIQYLQILIWKYSMELKHSESDVFPILLYDGQYLSDSVLTMLDFIHPLSPESWRTVKHSCGVRSKKKRKAKTSNHGSDGSKVKKKYHCRLLKNSNIRLTLKDPSAEDLMSSTKVKNEAFSYPQIIAGESSKQLTGLYLNMDRNNTNNKPVIKTEKNTFQMAQEPRRLRKPDYQILSPIRKRSKLMSMTNSPNPSRFHGKWDWNDVALKSPIPWMPRPSYIEETPPFGSYFRRTEDSPNHLLRGSSPKIFGTPSYNDSIGNLSSNYRLFALSPFGSPELFPGVERNVIRKSWENL